MPAPTYHIAHLLPIKTILQSFGDGREAQRFLQRVISAALDAAVADAEQEPAFNDTSLLLLCKDPEHLTQTLN